MLAVPRARVRLDLGLRDVARERLDLPLVRGQGEVHQPPSLLAVAADET